MKLKGPMKDVRLLLGFVLAPAVVPMASLLCAWGFVRHYAGPGADVDSLAPFVRYSFRIELPAAYLLTLLFAVPYVLSLRERGVLNFWMLLTPLTVVASSVVVLVCIAAPSFKYHAATAAVGIIAAGLCFHILSVAGSGRRCTRAAGGHFDDVSGVDQAMDDSMRYLIPRLYYFWTPAFILLDYVWGINVRVAVLDEMPLYKNLYYGLCILCGVIVYFRPRSAALVALVESSVILLLTLIGVFWPYVQIAALPEEDLDVVLAGFTIQRVVNLFLAGFIAVVGIYTSKDAVARACGLGKSESEKPHRAGASGA